MTSKELTDLINSHKKYSTRTFDQKSYKIGVNSAIYRASDKTEPDNRIPVPFIRRAVKLIKGYFAKVGNITYSDDSGWFVDNIKDIYDQNGEELCSAEIFEDAATYGRGFELHWYGKDNQFHFGTLPIDQCIPIYTDDLKPEMMGFVWVRELADKSDIATYYNDAEYITYRKRKNSNGSEEWIEVPEESGIHLYGRVPVLEANVDRDKRNLFDHCLPMTDFYDRLTSEVANEHEKFAESILLLRAFIDAETEDNEGFTEVDKLRQFRILDKLGDHVKDAAAYLERNVNDNFINNTLDRFERLLYEMLCIVNYSADNFAEASGIAQMYKLLGQELMVADIEAYFVNFLYNRISLIVNHKTSGIKDPENANYVTVNFKRNLPFDTQTMVQVASVALGGKQVLSHKTLLSLFPTTIVDDAKEEIKRIEEENDGSVLNNPMQIDEVMDDAGPGIEEEMIMEDENE